MRKMVLFPLITCLLLAGCSGNELPVDEAEITDITEQLQTQQELEPNPAGNSVEELEDATTDDNRWSGLFEIAEDYGLADMEGDVKAELAGKLNKMGYAVCYNGAIQQGAEQIIVFLDNAEGDAESTVQILMLDSTQIVVYELSQEDEMQTYTEYTLDVAGRNVSQMEYVIANIEMTDFGYMVIEYLPNPKYPDQIWQTNFRVASLPEEYIELQHRYIAPITDWHDSEWDESRFYGNMNLGFVDEFLQRLWMWENDSKVWYSRLEDRYWDAETMEFLFEKYFNISQQEVRTRFDYHKDEDWYTMYNDGGYGMAGYKPEVWGVVNNSDGSITLQICLLEENMFEFPSGMEYRNLTVMPREDETFYYISCKAAEAFSYPAG